MKEHEAARYMEDMRGILKPDMWPRWPFLPVKRKDGDNMWPEMGLLTDGDPDQQFRVYVTNLYKPDFENCDSYKYETVRELLDDGWRVD